MEPAKNTISVMGLGKVGSALVASLASSGFRVIGYDADPNALSDRRGHRFEHHEEKVRELFFQHQAQIELTDRPTEAVLNSSLTFVIVPTPSNSLGGFSLKIVKNALAQVATVIREKKERHTIALVSTVLPGSSDRILVPLLEEISGKKVGKDFGFSYNPAFIALGEIIKGFRRPDIVLIGESDPETGILLEKVHTQMLDRESDSVPALDTRISRMNLIEAEITKIASNTHETMRVSFANMLMQLCQELPGANVDQITSALNVRIGRRFFRGAVPYGGPCWPRDNVAFSTLMKSLGTSHLLPEAVDHFNEEHKKYILRLVLNETQPGERVGVVGLAYKVGTPYLDCSFGIELIQSLVREGRKVLTWDSFANDTAAQALADQVQCSPSAQGCIDESDALLLLQPIKDLEKMDFSNNSKLRVYDFWRYLSQEKRKTIAHYHAVGFPVADRKPETDHFGVLVE